MEDWVCPGLKWHFFIYNMPNTIKYWEVNRLLQSTLSFFAIVFKYKEMHCLFLFFNNKERNFVDRGKFPHRGAHRRKENIQSARIQDVDGIHLTFLMLWKTFSMAFDSLHYTSLSRPWWESAVTQYSANRIHSSSSSNAHFNFWTNQLLSVSGIVYYGVCVVEKELFFSTNL